MQVLCVPSWGGLQSGQPVFLPANNSSRPRARGLLKALVSDQRWGMEGAQCDLPSVPFPDCANSMGWCTGALSGLFSLWAPGDVLDAKTVPWNLYLLRGQRCEPKRVSVPNHCDGGRLCLISSPIEVADRQRLRGYCWQHASFLSLVQPLFAYRPCLP